MGTYSGLDDPMADIYGKSETLGGVASYLPGQNFAFDRDVITGMLDTLVSQGTSNIGGMLGLEGRIDAGMKALSDIIGFDATQATPEQIQEALNNVNDPTAGLINLTVGSNQPFVGVPSAADRAAAAATVDPVGGSTSSLESDGDLTGDLDTIIDSVASGGSTETVSDVNEEWTYNAATDSFISSTRGDSVPNAGNAVLKDGGVYTVTPIIGTDGVAAEHVVDAETNKSVGVLNVDINTGIPTITNETTTAVTAEVPVTSADTTGTADTAVVDTSGGAARPTDTTPTITPTPVTTTPTNGIDGGDGTDGKDGGDGKDGKDGGDGKDGKDGGDGGDGKDGKDGKDGATGLLMMGMLSAPLANNIFKTEFESNYLRPEYVDRILRGKGMNNNGRNT